MDLNCCIRNIKGNELLLTVLIFLSDSQICLEPYKLLIPLRSCVVAKELARLEVGIEVVQGRRHFRTDWDIEVFKEAR